MSPPFDSFTALLNYAFRLLGQRDYSERELLKKLTAKEAYLLKKAAEGGAKHPSGDDKKNIVGRVIIRLKELNYVNDEKFAKHFLENRAAFQPRGKYLLKMELKQKGIPTDNFEDMWEKEGYSEHALAERLLAQKKRLFNRLAKDKRKKKAMSLLASRGFSGDTIYSILERI